MKINDLSEIKKTEAFKKALEDIKREDKRMWQHVNSYDFGLCAEWKSCYKFKFTQAYNNWNCANGVIYCGAKGGASFYYKKHEV